MHYDIKAFQKRHGLTNREMAEICGCSLPTIQKWRSGEVAVSGAASQLLRLLDYASEGDPARLRSLMERMQIPAGAAQAQPDRQLDKLESSMSRVVDRLEVLLESRRKDRELASSEARYRSMVESSRNPVCRWLPDTTLTYVNEAYSAMFSRFGEKLLGRRWLDFIPDERRAAVAAIVSDLVRRGTEDTMLHEALDKDGRVRHMEWKDIPVKDERGDVVEFHSVGVDVTELVRLRGEVKEMQLLKSALMDIVSRPALLFDATGAIQEMNPAFKSDFMDGRECKNLSELMPAETAGRLKRLAKRLSSTQALCFQFPGKDKVLLLEARMVSPDSACVRFLGVISEAGAGSGSGLAGLRLRHEKVVEGKAKRVPVKGGTMAVVRQRMEKLGRAVRVDRVYVFLYDLESDLFDNVLEWCAKGVQPFINELQRLPMDRYPWLNQRLLKRQWLQVEDVSKLPRTADREREHLLAQDIRAVLVAPIMVNDGVVGFAGFDHNTTPRIWHEQEKTALGGFVEELGSTLSATAAN